MNHKAGSLDTNTIIYSNSNMIDILKYRQLSDEIFDVEQTGTNELTIIFQSDADVKALIKKANALAMQKPGDENLSIVFTYDNGRTIEPH
ncbi:hypothetical protein [Pedobacter agri]|uniref:hypothetical protein n=1 Tax=Pedobacter agri TaxID=454586 RepID=UPI00293018B3|nr:hypothetical protein [Pedobacter agri]